MKRMEYHCDACDTVAYPDTPNEEPSGWMLVRVSTPKAGPATLGNEAPLDRQLCVTCGTMLRELLKSGTSLAIMAREGRALPPVKR